MPLQRCVDVGLQFHCYWTVLEMNYFWACITLMASYFAKLCRLILFCIILSLVIVCSVGIPGNRIWWLILKLWLYNFT